MRESIKNWRWWLALPALVPLVAVYAAGNLVTTLTDRAGIAVWRFIAKGQP